MYDDSKQHLEYSPSSPGLLHMQLTHAKGLNQMTSVLLGGKHRKIENADRSTRFDDTADNKIQIDMLQRCGVEGLI